MSARTYDAASLFAAMSESDRAGMFISRAVTAGEAGRFSDQRALVEQATAAHAKALSLLNPAGSQTQHEERSAA